MIKVTVDAKFIEEAIKEKVKNDVVRNSLNKDENLEILILSTVNGKPALVSGLHCEIEIHEKTIYEK